MIRVLPLLVLFAGSSATRVQAETAAEDEIRWLIQAVADSHCEFDRNGKRYAAATAAEHLELKYARGKRYADSAEAFIERLATKSSWTGETYWMICDDDPAPAAQWLSMRLEELRAP
ncbi:MAG: DUF5329 family protein [Luminiphilus sp.]